jgi:protein ImuB
MKRILCLRIEDDRRVGEARKSTDDGALREPVQNNDQRFQGSDFVRHPPSPQRFAPRTLQGLAARCKQFTPLVGIDPDVFPQSVLLDITNVVHLFGGEAALVERLQAELHAEGWQFRTAVAGTPGAAWALASYTPQPPPRSPLPAPCSPLPALPLEALRLPEPIVALLHGLGVWRIGELQALPRRELSSRFGPELLDCLDRVTGRLPEPLPAWDPPPQFEVCWSAAEINEDWPTARREEIESALEHLVRRLADMLMRAGRGAMRLECFLKCTEGGSLQVAVGLFRPAAWANHLVELLQVRLESLQLPGPVDSIRLAATSTAPLELRQQEMFSEGRAPCTHGRRAGPHHLAGLIDRLSNRLGHVRVMGVRLVPDAQPELACHYAPLVGIKGSGVFCPRGKPHGRHPTPLLPLLPPRPLRLLTQPLRLPGGGHHVGHVPMVAVGGLFSFAGRQERVVRCVGPERIETGWWRGGHHLPMALVGVARDYYRLETATGRCYWVFRRLPAGPWFVHGMFD